MQRTHHSYTTIVFGLLLAAWLATTPATLAASTTRIEPASRSAITATPFRRGIGLVDDAASQTKRGCFDAPSSPLEERLFADAADGQLDTLSPLEAALVASAVGDVKTLQHYQRKAAALADEFRQWNHKAGTPRERAEAVFEFMHRRILCGGYDLAYTDLRRVLDDGRFNCVSATVLFNYLAGELGLDCRGLEMPGHAMSRLSLPDGTLDVENTCPRWFHLDADPEKKTAAITKTIGSASKVDYSKAREVSPVQLAAMIYYNRGVDLLAERQFAEAARVNAKALRLDPGNATARGNLLATINNWSIELGNRGQFAEAIELLRQGLAIDATFAAFAQNFVHVHHQWAEYLCERGHFEEAIEVLSQAAAEMPDREYLRKAQSEVRQRWAQTAVTSPAE